MAGGPHIAGLRMIRGRAIPGSSQLLTWENIMKTKASIGLLAAAWLSLSATTAFAGEVSCDGFALGYDGPAEKKTCLTENTWNVDTTSETKVLGVHDHDSYLS